jgi:DNA invertase Pin-like site-specific DNA recombinase
MGPTKVGRKMNPIADSPSKGLTSPTVALAYLRADSRWSIAEQQIAIQRYCQAKNLHLTRFYLDRSDTANIPLRDRPGGRLLWSDLQSGSCLVITQIFLAFASPAECLEIIRSIQARGVSLHVVHGTIGRPLVPTAVPVQQMAKFLEALRALDRKFRSETARTALLKLRRQGCRYTNFPGYGFRWVKRRGRQIRVVDPGEKKVIEWLKRLWLKGFSLDRLYCNLLENHIKQRNGKPWSRSRIYRVLGGGLAQCCARPPLAARKYL